MDAAIGFVIGLLIGNFFGFVLAALAMAAGKGDNDEH